MGDEAARTITADDVVSMNRTAVDRSAYLARIGGSVLIVVGVLAAVGWAWVQVRSQQQLDGIYGGAIMSDLELHDGHPTFVERIDLLLASVDDLWQPALALGGGLALRMLADFTQTRVGGSITGFTEGDVLDGSLFAEEEPADDEPVDDDEQPADDAR